MKRTTLAFRRIFALAAFGVVFIDRWFISSGIRRFACILLIFMLSLSVSGQTMLVSWNFPNKSDDAISDEGIVANLSQAITTAGETGTLVFNFAGSTTNAVTASRWTGGIDTKYWQVNFSTRLYSNIIISSKQRSSATGPRDFKMQYSINSGATWVDVAGASTTVADNFTTGMLKNVSLPQECSDNPFVQLRWIMTSNTAVGGGFVTDGGISQIDDIEVRGTLCGAFISSFTPANGPTGTKVTISGSDFRGTTGVFFSGVPATFTVISDNIITSTVPLVFTSGPISVAGATCSSSSNASFQLENTCFESGNNLIISELCDPQNNYQTDRYIEIFNPTKNPINLAGWTMKSISNAAECSTFSWVLSGIISPGQAMTCGNPNPVNGGPHNFTNALWDASIPGSCCNTWSGNRMDGAALYKGTTLIDYAWYEPTAKSWFSDHSLIRSMSICNPIPSPNQWQWTTAYVTDAGSGASTPRLHSSGCTGSPPEMTIHPVAQSVCSGSTVNLLVEAHGGVAPLTYQWKVLEKSGNWKNVTGNAEEYSGATTPVLKIITSDNLDNNQYFCEIANADGSCYQSSNAVSLTVNKNPVVTIESQTKVKSREKNTWSAKALVDQGKSPYTYKWNTPDEQTGETATVLKTGTYKVSVTDANGCSCSSSIVIRSVLIPPVITLDLQTDVNCYGGNTGAIDLTIITPSGDPIATTDWTGAKGFTGITEDISGLIADTYTIVVTDVAGGVATASYTITEPASALAATITAQTDVSCFGLLNGSVTVE
ncbi:MAG: lamin tail domain-containing protein, partial [Bacteroidales bacterium]